MTTSERDRQAITNDGFIRFSSDRWWMSQERLQRGRQAVKRLGRAVLRRPWLVSSVPYWYLPAIRPNLSKPQVGMRLYAGLYWRR